MGDPRLEYSRALESLDVEAIVALVTEDVTIRVAVHDEAMQGQEVATFLFGVLREELETIEITGEVLEGDRAVVLFETAIRGVRAQGLNVLELEGERIRELTVYFRPLAALQLISEVIGARMARQFGELEQ